MRWHLLLYLSMAGACLTYPMHQQREVPVVPNALPGNAAVLEIFLPVIKGLIQPAANLAMTGIDVLIRKDFAPLIDSDIAHYLRVHNQALAEEYSVLVKCVCEALHTPETLILVNDIKSAIKILVEDPAFAQAKSGKDLLNLKGYKSLKCAVATYLNFCFNLLQKQESRMPLGYSAISKVIQVFTFEKLEQAFANISFNDKPKITEQERIKVGKAIDSLDKTKFETIRDTAVMILAISTMLVPEVIMSLGDKDLWQWARSLRIENGIVRESATMKMPQRAIPLVVALSHLRNLIAPSSPVIQLQ